MGIFQSSQAFKVIQVPRTGSAVAGLQEFSLDFKAPSVHFQSPTFAYGCAQKHWV